MMQILTAWSVCLILLFASFTHHEDVQQIPPDHAQIEGIILALFNRNDTRWAAVKVTVVKGYGSGFRSSLNPSDTIEVKLNLELMEGEAETLVSVNDTFSGNIKQGLSGLMGGKSITYEMHNYTKF